MNCSQCESLLLVEVFGTSNPIRCASCGSISAPPNQQASKISLHAQRSLWLGLASIVLLFLTGIPAIWYGVRSLLQMRFVRSRQSDKRAATIGATLGMIFGVLGLAVVSVVGGIAMTVALLKKDLVDATTDSERINEIYATIGTLEVPDGFRPHEASSFKDQFQKVTWQDGSDDEDINGRVLLVDATRGSVLGDQQFAASKLRIQLYEDITVEPDLRKVETLSWKFSGEPREVRKTIETVEDGDFDSVLYSATAEDEDASQVLALSVVIRKPGKYAEEDVQKIFESFQKKK